ncbi:hypothetical protein HY251_01965 [bacterium]|nr:hypothetical protein [bacterium]
MDRLSTVEPRLKVGKALAHRFGLRIETLRAGLVAAGCALEKPGRRGTYISESELGKYIAWTRRRAAGGV